MAQNKSQVQFTSPVEFPPWPPCSHLRKYIVYVDCIFYSCFGMAASSCQSEPVCKEIEANQDSYAAFSVFQTTCNT